MLKFFRKILQNLLREGPPAGRAGKTGNYLKYAIGEILPVLIRIVRPFRDRIWVGKNHSRHLHRAVRYGICRFTDVDTLHIAYLRHANLYLYFVIYLCAVPTGQGSSAKFHNPTNPQFPC